MGSDYPKKTIEVFYQEDISGGFGLEGLGGIVPAWRAGIFEHQAENYGKDAIIVECETVDRKKEALEHAKHLQDWYSEHQLPIHVYTMEDNLQRIIEPS